jgi:outer membrane lipoprotein-sorting protein
VPVEAEQGPPPAHDPKDEALKKEVVAIEIVLDEALGMKEWRLVRANGDELKLAVTDFVPNAKLAPKELEFDVPAGVKIVRMGADAPKSDGAKGGEK